MRCARPSPHCRRTNHRRPERRRAICRRVAGLQRPSRCRRLLWGGSQSFRFATNNQQIQAAVVFYGSGPDAQPDLERITAPVFGFYGGNDARVNSTIPRSKEQLAKAGKKYEPVIYEGAGHGFMRPGKRRTPAPKTRQHGSRPGSGGRRF